MSLKEFTKESEEIINIPISINSLIIHQYEGLIKIRHLFVEYTSLVNTPKDKHGCYNNQDTCIVCNKMWDVKSKFYTTIEELKNKLKE